MEIKNTGNQPALDINLETNLDWLTFNENDIDVPINGNKYVTFSISPNFNKRNLTGKTYEGVISAIGTNTIEYTKTISIEIPLDESLIEETNLDWEALIDELRKLMETASEQNQTIEDLMNNNTVQMNFTQEDMYRVIRSIGNNSDQEQRWTASFKFITDNMATKTQQDEMDRRLNETNARIDENNQTTNSLTFLLLVGALCFVVIIGTWFMVSKGLKFKKAEKTNKFQKGKKGKVVYE